MALAQSLQHSWDGGSRVHTRLPGLRQGTTVCVPMRMDMEELSDHKPITPSDMGLLVCGAGSQPSCHLGVQEGMCHLNRYSGSGSCIPWCSDNESLFGPPNQTKLKVSMSLGSSVEFKVRRRVQGEVPSLITLDHGDLLVTDGLTQLEYVHCTASGLQGPRVNLTFRWVAQHIASCPLAGADGCVLPSCVQGLAEPGPRGDWSGENKWVLLLGVILLLVILVLSLWGSTWISTRGRLRHSCRRLSCPAVHFPSRGPARWVGGRRWRLSRRYHFSKRRSFYFRER